MKSRTAQSEAVESPSGSKPEAEDAARAAASIVLLTSSLSVIVDAIKESRRISERMDNYAIYRIAEPLSVLLFMTPIGWGWALFVWAYAVAWFLVTDREKRLAYRLCDPAAL